MTDNSKRPKEEITVIAICGPSGAGKTTLVEKVAERLGDDANPTSVAKWYLHVEDLHDGYADGKQETGGIGAHYIYERMMRVAQTADVVLDGMQDPDQLAREVVEAVRA